MNIVDGPCQHGRYSGWCEPCAADAMKHMLNVTTIRTVVIIMVGILVMLAVAALGSGVLQGIVALVTCALVAYFGLYQPWAGWNRIYGRRD